MIDQVIAAATGLRGVSERYGVEPDLISGISRLLSAKGTVYVPLAALPQPRALIEYLSDGMDVRASVMTPDEAEALNRASHVVHVVHDSLRVPYSARSPNQPATYVLLLPFTKRSEFEAIEPFVEAGLSSAADHFDRLIIAGHQGISNLYEGNVSRLYANVKTHPVIGHEIIHGVEPKVTK